MTKEEVLRQNIIELENSNKDLEKSIQDAREKMSQNSANIELLLKQLAIENLVNDLRTQLTKCPFSPVEINMLVKGEHRHAVYNIVRKV